MHSGSQSDCFSHKPTSNPLLPKVRSQANQATHSQPPSVHQPPRKEKQWISKPGTRNVRKPLVPYQAIATPLSTHTCSPSMIWSRQKSIQHTAGVPLRNKPRIQPYTSSILPAGCCSSSSSSKLATEDRSSSSSLSAPASSAASLLAYFWTYSLTLIS